MLFTLARDGTASARKMLDSGSNLYVDDADASVPGDIVVGGSIGGDAAVFHLSAAP
jgi:hypothetical protein